MSEFNLNHIADAVRDARHSAAEAAGEVLRVSPKLIEKLAADLKNTPEEKWEALLHSYQSTLRQQALDSIYKSKVNFKL